MFLVRAIFVALQYVKIVAHTVTSVEPITGCTMESFGCSSNRLASFYLNTYTFVMLATFRLVTFQSFILSTPASLKKCSFCYIIISSIISN